MKNYYTYLYGLPMKLWCWEHYKSMVERKSLWEKSTWFYK
jgi:hypothetical protein